MFRPIRRKKKEMDIDAAKELLQCSRRGVLAVNGDDGYPYAVPVNYFYDSDAGKIYFHGARTGHKVDALKASDKVCFTVYDFFLKVKDGPDISLRDLCGRNSLVTLNYEFFLY